MTKTLFASCVAASFLLSSAALAPSWAIPGDVAKGSQIIFAEGDEPDQAAPQEEQGGEDRDGFLFNSSPTFSIAQSEESGASEPKPEEEGESGGGGD